MTTRKLIGSYNVTQDRLVLLQAVGYIELILLVLKKGSANYIDKFKNLAMSLYEVINFYTIFIPT